MLKRWLDVGRCVVGLHQGDWVPAAIADCTFVRTCLICGTESRELRHEWGEWAVAVADPCLRRRCCGRCHTDESTEEHQPGDWTYDDPASCTQVQHCSRCRRPYDETRVAHVWGDWEYQESLRQPARWCRRCGGGGVLIGVAPPAARPSSTAVVEPPSPGGGVTRREGAAPETDDGMLSMLAMIRGEYDAQVARGQIAASRQPRYRAMLDELDRLLRSPATDLASLQARTRRVQDMLAGFSAAMMDPSRSDPGVAPAGETRAAMLLELVGRLHAYVMAEIGNEQLTNETGAALGRVVTGLHVCRDLLAVPGDEAAIALLEVDTLRPLMLELQQLALRDHLGVVCPVWASPAVAQRADAVFYAGGGAVGAEVTAACDERRLHLLVPRPHREPGSLRWQQLREAAVAIFDFTGYRRTADPSEAAPVASVAYEFGMALALGRPTVILADAAAGLPFDLDITPVVLDRAANDSAVVGAALDATLYGVQRGRAGSSVRPTLQWLRQRFETHPEARVRISLRAIDETLAQDAVKARLVASTVVGYHEGGYHAVCPAWPVTYPDQTARRCFHVTPFGPSWARRTRDIVRQACSGDVTYVRGDQPLDPDIVRSIWDEIGNASHIVVDLTGLNANVLVELGMAHALGRRVLLISQDQQPERYFPALAKHRVHTYALRRKAELGTLVAGFIAHAD